MELDAVWLTSQVEAFMRWQDRSHENRIGRRLEEIETLQEAHKIFNGEDVVVPVEHDPIVQTFDTRSIDGFEILEG